MKVTGGHLGQVEVVDEDDALLAHGGAVHALPPAVQLGHDHVCMELLSTSSSPFPLYILNLNVDNAISGTVCELYCVIIIIL